MIVIYLFSFGLGFLYDKLQKKIISLFIVEGFKQLKYTDAWHRQHPLHPLYVVVEWCEWIVV